mmetsp:Transcript_15924/g.24601  ORF Transcript_15924/g.24601 Transcript_15924/m.24601 type:complete len:82 (+) Transcript_15924:2691-2936(+)
MGDQASTSEMGDGLIQRLSKASLFEPKKSSTVYKEFDFAQSLRSPTSPPKKTKKMGTSPRKGRTHVKSKDLEVEEDQMELQ